MLKTTKTGRTLLLATAGLLAALALTPAALCATSVPGPAVSTVADTPWGKDIPVTPGGIGTP